MNDWELEYESNPNILVVRQWLKTITREELPFQENIMILTTVKKIDGLLSKLMPIQRFMNEELARYPLKKEDIEPGVPYKSNPNLSFSNDKDYITSIIVSCGEIAETFAKEKGFRIIRSLENV